MFGKLIIYISSFAFFLSFLLFIFAEYYQNHKYLKYAKISFFSATVCILLASLFLVSNILSHNFTLTYVWSYSSRNLPFLLLLSTFYAGQEGSFLLWALWMSLVGLVFFLYLKKHQLGYLPVSFFSLAIFFVVLIIIFKSPFENIWESFPESDMPKDFVPPDGRGLNPILENYWIAFHPPILFLGYSLVTVPFTLLLTSFLEKNFEKYTIAASFWSLIAAGILGLGIMLGGFWAYETLGWGGFWGWDPVENSSLVPWIFLTALIHSLLIQRIKSTGFRISFLLSWLAFLGVLYASYLTRSGVLSDTSVHSFVDPGKTVNILLLVYLGVFTFFPLILFITRAKFVPEIKERIKINSRQFMTYVGAVIFIIASIVIIVGTSLPIIQGFVGAKKVALEPSFYNQWMTPIAFLILIFNGISLLLHWRETPTNTFRNKLIYSIVPSLGIAVIFLFIPRSNLLFSLLIFSSVFSLIINGEKLLNKLSMRNLKIGALLSHLGISFLIVGALLSGGFEDTQTIQLQEGKISRAFGYELHLLKKERIEIEKPDREKYRFKIKIVDKDKNSIVYPIVYWSSFNNFEQPYYEPDIKTYLTKDLYLAPKSFTFNEFYSPISFKKGEILSAPWSEKDSIRFVSYDMSSMHFGKSQENFTFGIIVDYYIDGNYYKDTVLSLLNMKSGSFSPIWKNVPTKDFAIGFTKFTPEENLEKSTVELSFGQEIFIADVTVKPFILLVWIGVIFTVAGFIIAVFKYSMKRTQKDEHK